MTQGTASTDANRGEKVRFLSWEILDPLNGAPHMLTWLGPVTLRFVVRVNQEIRRGQHGVALFNADRQLIWAWAKENVRMEPGVHSFTYTFPMLPLRPGVYAWQASLWEDRELLELWDCLPEMNIATQVLQHPLDEWNGVLNIPCEFSIVNGGGGRIETATSF